MGRPEWSSTLSTRQRDAIGDMVFELRGEGYGWNECAKRVTSRFPTVHVSERTLKLAFSDIDPQQDISPAQVARLQNHRRAHASSRAWWRRRRAYIYAKYKEAAGR